MTNKIKTKICDVKICFFVEEIKIVYPHTLWHIQFILYSKPVFKTNKIDPVSSINITYVRL